MELPRSSGGFSIETVEPNHKVLVDDDGHEKRKGTVMTVSAHIITAVIGSGVLSLAWAIAQLGWIAGVVSLGLFSIITLYTSNLLSDCYRFPDKITGARNYTYMEAVEKFLGGLKYKLCGVCQYLNLIGTSIGYTITTALSIGAIQKSQCLHKYGPDAKCRTSYEMFTIGFAVLQIFVSQIPNFHKLSGLSIIAAAMSFTYSLIGICLSIIKISGGSNPKTSLTGISIGPNVTSADKVWRSFQALGNIAFAYGYSQILIEIQDTIKSGKPENKKMKQATAAAVAVTTVFYMLCGLLGYVAFGDNAPGNFLAGFGYFEPAWIVDLANVCIVIHLVGAYQVFAQPVYRAVENQCREKWPESDFIVKEYGFKLGFLGTCNFNMFRAIWRSSYVIVTCGMAIMLPFFNDIMGLLGALIFWPLTVYFPVEMHIAQNQIPKFSRRWIALNVLSFACLIVSIVAAAGSIQGIATELKTYRPFTASDS